MSNIKSNPIVHDSIDYPTLLQGCHRARYAELLSPEEVAEMSASDGLETAPTGWVIHAELSNQDIEHLTQLRKPLMRLVVQDFDGGLPVFILTTQVRGMRFQWAVPLWEADAQEWLKDSIERGRFVLMLKAVDAPVSVTLMTAQEVMQDADELLRAATVEKQPTGDEHLFYMLNVGLRLMNDRSSRFASTQDLPNESRVMVAGRGANAVHLMNTFVAASAVAHSLAASAADVIQ
jgi:hypothetical protein